MREKRDISICIKTEPAGEYCCGKLNDDQAKDILEHLQNNDFMERFFEENPPYEFDSEGHAYGVLTSCSPDGDLLNKDDFKSISYNEVGRIEFPPTGKDIEPDGFYVVMTATDKMSFEHHIEQSEAVDIIMNYVSVNINDIEDVYGELYVNILESVSINGEPVEMELIDRGNIRRSITIAQLKEDDYRVIYGNIDGDIFWGEPF